MTKTTIKITDMNDGSDYIQHEVELGQEYKTAFEMAKAAAKRNGCTLKEAAQHIVITTVVTTHETAADFIF